MVKFSYYVSCIAIASIAFSIAVAGQAWTLLIVPGVYFFYLHVKQYGVKYFYKRKSQLFLLLFIVSILFSNFMNLGNHSDPVRGFKKVRYLLVCFFNLYTLDYLVASMGSKKRAKLLANLLIYGFTLSTIYAYVSSFTAYDFINGVPEELGDRVTGVTGIMNYGYETPLVVLFCLSIGFYFNRRENVGLGILNLLGVVFSGTRGGVVSLFAGTPLLIYYYFRKHLKTALVVGLIALTLLFVIIAYFGVDIGRFSAGHTYYIERMKCAQLSLQAFKDSPVYGHGLLNEKKAYQIRYEENGEMKYRGDLVISESTYLQIIADMGLIGIVSYVAFLFYWVKEVWQRKDIMSYLLFPSIVAFIVSSLVHTMFVSGTTTAVLISYLYNFSVIDEGVVKKVMNT